MMEPEEYEITYELCHHPPIKNEWQHQPFRTIEDAFAQGRIQRSKYPDTTWWVEVYERFQSSGSFQAAHHIDDPSIIPPPCTLDEIFEINKLMCEEATVNCLIQDTLYTYKIQRMMWKKSHEEAAKRTAREIFDQMSRVPWYKASVLKKMSAYIFVDRCVRALRKIKQGLT